MRSHAYTGSIDCLVSAQRSLRGVQQPSRGRPDGATWCVQDVPTTTGCPDTTGGIELFARSGSHDSCRGVIFFDRLIDSFLQKNPALVEIEPAKFIVLNECESQFRSQSDSSARQDIFALAYPRYVVRFPAHNSLNTASASESTADPRHGLATRRRISCRGSSSTRRGRFSGSAISSLLPTAPNAALCQSVPAPSVRAGTPPPPAQTTAERAGR